MLFQAPYLADGLNGISLDDYRAQTGVRLGGSWQDLIKTHSPGTSQVHVRRKHYPRKLAIATQRRRETTLSLKRNARGVGLANFKSANATLHRWKGYASGISPAVQESGDSGSGK